MLFRLFSAVLLLMAGASGQSDDFYRSLIDSIPQYPGDWLRWAPLVVRVHVVDNQAISDSLPARLDPETKLVRRRVRGNVLEVLRRPDQHGELVANDGQLEFAYYALDRERIGQAIRMRQFRAEPGHQYLFGLMEDQGRLRSIGDVGPYSMEVHGEPDPPGPEMQLREIKPASWQRPDVGRRIAGIVLAPCGHCDPEQYAASVSGNATLAKDLSGRLVASARIRTLARIALRRYFPATGAPIAAGRRTQPGPAIPTASQPR